MSHPILLAAIAVPLLLAAVLLTVLRRERQRQLLQTRLKGMTTQAPSEPAPSLLLRKPQRQAGLGAGVLAPLHRLVILTQVAD
jgi:hypothetical protein